MKYFMLLLVCTLAALGQDVPVLQNPTTSQTILQPQGTTFNVNVLNGVVQLYPNGTQDMCAQIAGAISSLLVAGGGDIDATHFSGKQPCAHDPFVNTIPGGWGGNLSVRLGHVTIQSLEPWQIQDTKITLTGISPAATQLVYTGGSAAQAVLIVSPSDPSNGNPGAHNDCGNARIENLFLVGNGKPDGTANATRSTWAQQGLLAVNCHRSEFNNVWAWGIQNVGIYVQGGVSDSLRAPRVSKYDANEVLSIIMQSSSEVDFKPAVGIQLDEMTTTATPEGHMPMTTIYPVTAGTITDAAVEGVSGTGIVCVNARNMVFLAGTSEENGQGVYISPSCFNMTLVGMDLELNPGASGIDLHDDGDNTTLVNLYAPNRILNPHSPSMATTGICQGAACWLTGSSAPSGSCNLGSIFTRTDSGTLYVCQASGWTAK